MGETYAWIQALFATWIDSIPDLTLSQAHSKRAQSACAEPI